LIPVLHHSTSRPLMLLPKLHTLTIDVDASIDHDIQLLSDALVARALPKVHMTATMYDRMSMLRGDTENWFEPTTEVELVECEDRMVNWVQNWWS
jgi:hypothetical protein